MKSIIFIISIVILTAIKAQVYKNIQAGEESSQLKIKTNEDYISSVRNNIDLSSTLDVFESVFNALNVDVIVYPSENYYYFQFETNGRTIKGNIALFAIDRDKGKLNFAYEEISALEEAPADIVDGVATLDGSNGVDILKINDFVYKVTFKDKSVNFHLNRLDMKQPSSFKLHNDEVYIGNTFDESGIRFHLLYNTLYKNLFWVLNEEYYVPESFTELIDNVIIGKRTGFIFYTEKKLQRKILFGVKNENIISNNWFDGPFDQLPDNYIETNEVELKKYIEESYPFCKDKIDKFGHFLKENDSRVAISTYLAYNSYLEILKVYYACKNSSLNEQEFIFNLTKERYFNSDES